MFLQSRITRFTAKKFQIQENDTIRRPTGSLNAEKIPPFRAKIQIVYKFDHISVNFARRAMKLLFLKG